MATQFGYKKERPRDLHEYATVESAVAALELCACELRRNARQGDVLKFDLTVHVWNEEWVTHPKEGVVISTLHFENNARYEVPRSFYARLRSWLTRWISDAPIRDYGHQHDE